MANTAARAGEALNSMVPSPLQIAFALAIVQTRPDSIPLTEYIRKLRKHLRTGRQPEKQPTKHRHLDAITFWRTQYEQSESRHAGLQAKVAELQRANDALAAKLRTFDIIASTRAPSKRKDVDSVDAMLTGTSKKAKTKNDSATGRADDEVMGPLGQDFEGLDGEEARSLVHHLYKIHVLCQKCDPKLDTFSYHLLQATSALVRTISVESRRHREAIATVCSRSRRPQATTSPAASPESELAASLRVATRAVATILYGFGRFRRLEGAEEPSGLVLHECARTFRSVLDDIAEASRANAKQSLNLMLAQEPKSRPRAKQIRLAKDQSTQRALGRFLSGVLISLDPSEPLHRELFEAFMFVLLERVGKRLYLCTFNHERGVTIEADISMPVAQGAGSGTNQELELRTLSLEVPSLIMVLERAMLLASKHMSAAVPAKASATKSATRSTTLSTAGPAGPKGTLSVHAREKLQQTLVNGIFGDSGNGKELNCLRMPPRLGPVPPIPKVEERDIPIWFRQEVWRLLGWEILGKDDSW